MTGDPVQYSNAGGDSVGGPLQGLVNGQTYYVIRLANDPNDIQLAASLFQALIGQQDLFGNEFLRDYGNYLGVNVNPGSIISPSEQLASIDDQVASPARRSTRARTRSPCRSAARAARA